MNYMGRVGGSASVIGLNIFLKKEFQTLNINEKHFCVLLL